MQTHEAFISAVAALAVGRLGEQDQAKLAGIKLAYGAGPAGVRGVTYFGRWKGHEGVAPFVEICALGQEHSWQVVGTTLHELGHALAGWEAGHGPMWRECCGRLGLRRAKAAGMAYSPAAFTPDVREGVYALPKPDEGEPIAGLGTVGNLRGGAPLPGPAVWKPCQAGTGTRGGKSRGKGAGSRYRLYTCECIPPVKLRAASDLLAVKCMVCLAMFHMS